MIRLLLLLDLHRLIVLTDQRGEFHFFIVLQEKILDLTFRFSANDFGNLFKVFSVFRNRIRNHYDLVRCPP